MNEKGISTITAAFLIAAFVGPLTYLYIKQKRSDKGKSNSMIFEFPQLKGSYAVGTTTRYLLDTHRKEPHNPQTQRELMVYIWYPAKTNKNSLVAYGQDGVEETKASLRRKGYLEQDLDILNKVYSHAVPEAEVLVKNGPYPVVLFSHGYLGCEPQMYTAFCEELASHGYIAVSIAHTYYASEVKFPDGRIIRPSPEKYAQQTMPSKQEEELWVDDIKFVLDSLDLCNKNPHDTFYTIFDLKQVGIVGHSMGGVAAYELCLKDSRFQAGIALDSLPFENNIINNLNKPFLVILAQETIDTMYASDEELAKKMKVTIADIVQMREMNRKMLASEKNNYEEIAKSKSVSYLIVPDIKHMGFSDLLLLKELSIYKNHKNILDMDAGLGSANGYKTINLINEYIVNFFDTYLKS